MENERREICFDEDLGIEAYRFEELMQRFPNHFHDHYVIGFIECGTRALSVGEAAYEAGAGDLLLFNPLDTHTCAQIDGGVLDYRCLNVPQEVMRGAAKEITGRDAAPRFCRSVVEQYPHIPMLYELHARVVEQGEALEKEERFLFLIEILIREYSEKAERQERAQQETISGVRDFLEANYTQSVTLAQLCALCGLDKFQLLRTFTRAYGITPYQYLETVRVNRAKELLKNGALPVEVAMQSGFSDQSHFSNFFKRFIGLMPGQYRTIFMK